MLNKKTKKKGKYLETSTLNINNGPWNNRIMIATPATGLVRMEWVMARYGQIIPTNWSSIDLIQFINAFVPMKYLLADAENIVVKEAIDKKIEWLLFIEQDNVLPKDAFIKINQYINKGDVPVVSGLYFTKSIPAEPILYRGRGNSYFGNWKMGDKVWVDGIPMGFTLIHCSILKEMYKDSEEYEINGSKFKRVFRLPDRSWGDPESGVGVVRGTTDLDWCTRVMEGGYFKKAGWSKYQNKKYPFLVDTNIFLKHIDDQGRLYPIEKPGDLGF